MKTNLKNRPTFNTSNLFAGGPIPQVAYEYLEAFESDFENWFVAFEKELREWISREEKKIEPEPQKCRVCGAPLTISAAEFGKVTYACSTAKPLTTGQWEHYQESHVYHFTNPVARQTIEVLKELLGDE